MTLKPGSIAPPAQPRPDLRWLRLLVVLVAANYGFWGIQLWSMGRSDGEPTPVLVGLCLGLALSALFALKVPARAAWALAALGLLGWCMALATTDRGVPDVAGLLVITAFYFPAFALAWLSRANGLMTHS